MVIVKLTHIVRPSEAKPDEIMYLHASDQIKDIAHTPTIYFYKHSAALDVTDPILRLKHSLSKALVLFYPLAGRLIWAAEGGGRVELHCNGKGVPIFEAESEAAVEDFGDFSPTPAMRSLLPPLDYTTTPIDEIPLLTVQLTRFRCGGVSIGLGVSHVIADGPSALHFIDEWAKISRGGEDQVVIPPYLDRKVLDTYTYKPLSSASNPWMLRPLPVLIGQEDDLKQPKKIVYALLKLNKLQIENLRNKSNGNAGRGYTRFEVVAAHIWRCATKARGHAAEQETSVVIIADFRNKMNPPLPKNYFGNALIRVNAMDNSGSLLSNSVRASEKIHEAVEKVTEDTVRAYLEYLKGLPDVGKFRSRETDGRLKPDFLRNPNLAIVSWTALPLYGTDFGWGKEIHMGTLSSGGDGVTFIIPSRDSGGAFDIVTWLQEEHMPDFKKYFYHDI